jgi:hypothetical protein
MPYCVEELKELEGVGRSSSQTRRAGSGGRTFVLQQEVYLTIEDELCRTGHIDVIVALSPFDVKRAAVHHDFRLSAGPAGE